MSFDMKDSVTVDWEKLPDISYDVYYSSEENFDVDNYTIFDHPGMIVDSDPPVKITLPEPIELIYVKVVPRSGQIEGKPMSFNTLTRFTLRGENMEHIHDSVNDVTWRRCSEGQLWDQDSVLCTGNAIEINDGQVRATYNEPIDGWRLPTTDEMLSLHSCDSGAATEDCISRMKVGTLPTIFRGSTLRAYYDDTALAPFYESGPDQTFVRAHSLHENEMSSVSSDEDLSMHVMLVRDDE